MIDGLRPYPAYRDSGQAWLGEVPQHWDVRRQRNTTTMLVSNVDKIPVEGELPVRLCNYVEVYKHDRITASLPFMKATARADEMRFRLEAGDVIITKDSESWTDIGVPALVEYTAPDLVCGYHLALLRPRPGVMHGPFLLRALQTPQIARQLHVAANGVTRYALSHDAIKSMVLPVPPLHEQAAIVRFIDHADRQIRRYISAKQKLIKLLEEEREVLVRQAITCAVDGSVQLRSSHVQWLGDVPAHWDLRRLKQVAALVRGKFSHRPRNDPALYDGAYPFIQTGDVARASGTVSGYRQTLNDRGLAVSRLAPAGTLVMAIAANIGDVAILGFDACYPDSIVGFVPRSAVERDFLYHVLDAMKPELIREAPVNTQGNLNVERLGAMWIPLPPLPEQRRIVDAIERATAKQRDAIDHAAREMALLHEFRTRLIADVVTGKVDVRVAAASLPDELEEPKPPVGFDDDVLGDDGDADLFDGEAVA